jgi:hypothetical protein
MVSLYTKNDKYYLLTTCGTYYNIAVEFGNTNNQIISNEFLSTCREIPFNLDEISNILILFKKLQTPINKDYITYIDNNRYVVNINRYAIINNWLDLHNYIL